ncbi:pancreatic lipase-related protein 2 [Nasonia vitripennis]|uniref:phospholipase A1 n=1 Tax=Nasonia vitripennis TaxID=7425 RepID=A0A7M7M6G3_NASVI|nr:pancreatic lipase-related protein 2 [Nasonia vitripennis]
MANLWYFLLSTSFVISTVNKCILANPAPCRTFKEYVDYFFEDDDVEVEFFKYTIGHNNVKNLKFDPAKRTTIIVHGFMNTHKNDWIRKMRQKLLQWQDMNVIVVDWSSVFLEDSFAYYKEAARKTEFVADEIYNFLINWAKKNKKTPIQWPYLHLIGHSLGAHIVGQVAKKLKPHVHVDRVTALDPAKPFFIEGAEGADLKLDKSCAQFVDVIHTNSHPRDDTFGLYEPLGHIDFYPNGGDQQWLCSNDREGRTLSKDSVFIKCFSHLFLGMDLSQLYGNITSRFLNGHNMVCDHNICPEYFTDSINSKEPLYAYKVNPPIRKKKNRCSNTNRKKGTWVEMGMNAYLYNNSRYHGTYYIDIPC